MDYDRFISFGDLSSYFEFEAIFGEDKCFFGEKEYLLGEILIEFLNFDETNFLDQLEKADKMLRLIGGNQLSFEECESKILEMDSIVTDLSRQIKALPIYGDFESKRFIIINPFLDNIHMHREENKESYERAVKTGIPLDSVYFIECAELTLNEFIGIANDIYRIKTVYANILDNYINRKGAMPNIREISLAISKYLKDNTEDVLRQKENFSKYNLFIWTQDVSISHTIKKTDSGELILCEVISGNGLNDFIYLEFFRALIIGYIPKRCKNCNRYFLIKGGYNHEYCDRISPNEVNQTCSMVGASRSFSEKVKQNPVWQEYTRLYKRYCARRRKGKMTDHELSAWVVYASNKRDELLNREPNASFESVNKNFLDKYKFDIDWDKNEEYILKDV